MREGKVNSKPNNNFSKSKKDSEDLHYIYMYSHVFMKETNCKIGAYLEEIKSYIIVVLILCDVSIVRRSV